MNVPSFWDCLEPGWSGQFQIPSFSVLVARGEIDRESVVQSPELTKNQEVTLLGQHFYRTRNV